MEFKSIKDINVSGKKVLVRVDFNVPVKDGEVADDFRIKKVLETLEYLESSGAKTLLISHIESTDTLEPVFNYLSPRFSIKFVKSLNDAENALSSCDKGEFVLLENVRKFSGEKENDESFAKDLAGLGDFYVNDAFSVSHRLHASVVGIPNFLPGYAGFLFQKEVENLSKAFKPIHPFLFILGGAKFDTKMPLVEKFLEKSDQVFIGGALANDIYKAKGYEVGVSLVSEGEVDFGRIMNSKKIIISSDVIVSDGEKVSEKSAEDVGIHEKIVDNGPKSVEMLKELSSKAKFILWNGPLGNYENGFGESTEKLAKILSESKAVTIVGGGDTVAEISKLGLEEKFTFVSTGGGAMLDFLANETLPGIEALEKSL